MIYAGLFQLDTVAWRHRKQGGSIVSGNQGAMFQGNAGTPAVEDVKTSDEKRERNQAQKVGEGGEVRVVSSEGMLSLQTFMACASRGHIRLFFHPRETGASLLLGKLLSASDARIHSRGKNSQKCLR